MRGRRLDVLKRCSRADCFRRQADCDRTPVVLYDPHRVIVAGPQNDRCGCRVGEEVAPPRAIDMG